MKISYTTMFLLGIGLLLCGGCSNDIDTDSSQATDGLVPVRVVMQGYQDLDEGTAEVRSVSENPSVEVIKQDMDIPGYEDYEMVTTVEKTPIQEVRTRGTMNVNSVFSMFVYDSKGTDVGNWQYQVSGTAVNLIGGSTENGPMLEPGTYKFVCTTYNSDKFDSNLSGIAVKNGEDFATCHVTKVISMTDSSIPVNFIRQITQFQVTASATGFTNNTVTFGSVSVSNLYLSGAITLSNASTDNTLIVGTNSTSLSFAGNTPNKIIPVARTKDFTLKNIVIEGVDRGDKKVTIAAAFERGKNYKINISFEKKNGFLFGGLIWASGNLRYVNGAYSISKPQDQVSGVNGNVWNAIANPDYWSYNTLTPTATSGNNGDPCSRVSPMGTWRLPTKSNFEALMRSSYVRGVSSNGVTGYFFGVTTVPSASDQEKILFLPSGGYRYPVDNKLYSVGYGGGFYWTSTNYDNTQAYHLYLHPDLGPDMKYATKDTGLNIRCVRNP